MKYDIKGVHYDLTDVTKEFLESKLSKISYGDEYVMGLHFTLSKGKGTNDWKAEAKITFKWGTIAYIEETAFNLHEAIAEVIEKLDHKITKEKEKIQDKHPHDQLQPEVE